MKAIDKAWKENLKDIKENQWESKKELIENCCPYLEYNLKIKGFEDDEILCEEYNEDCTKCWNSEIDEESIFEKIGKHPSLDISLNWNSEEYFVEGLKKNEESLICIAEEEAFTYNNIPSIIKYLQDVYNYCTELKANMIEYVDFETAREYMESNSGNITKYKDYEYYIKNNELYRVDDDGACALTLGAINSKEWILL